MDLKKGPTLGLAGFLCSSTKKASLTKLTNKIKDSINKQNYCTSNIKQRRENSFKPFCSSYELIEL